MQGADFGWKNKDHFRATCFQNLTTFQAPQALLLHGDIVHLYTIPSLDLEKPDFFLGAEVNPGVLSRNHLARAEIDVNEVFVILGDALRWASNIDDKFCDVESPVLSGDLGIGLDTAAIGFMYRVCMILAGLWRALLGNLEVLNYLREQLVIVAYRLSRLVGSEVGFVIVGGFGRRRVINLIEAALVSSMMKRPSCQE